MPGALQIRDDVVVPESELQWRFSRSSGPGGQSVNTSDTRVELTLDITASQAFTDLQRGRLLERLRHRTTHGLITVTASEHRSQLRNREAAEQRLAQLLREGLAPPPLRRRATRPSRSSVRRRLDTKRRRGDVKQQRRPPTS
ncbi:MAG: aminoacyl-tRNA hydrolase [Propionibacteriales bacterium]|jgi:ribosome-associated protein|nr:aminoacyl-tRNA hydrolase [Propionibacteriales bacterium]